MIDSLMASYDLAIYSLGTLALLLIIQLLIADVTGIRAKHTPGTPVAPNHDNFLFRSTRVVANVNESIAIYIASLLFCILTGADGIWVGYVSWLFVASRAAYAICYYTNLQILRSVCFAFSLLAIAGLLITGLTTGLMG